MVFFGSANSRPTCSWRRFRDFHSGVLMIYGDSDENLSHIFAVMADDDVVDDKDAGCTCTGLRKAETLLMNADEEEDS